jgi:hypothetical protein
LFRQKGAVNDQTPFALRRKAWHPEKKIPSFVFPPGKNGIRLRGSKVFCFGVFFFYVFFQFYFGLFSFFVALIFAFFGAAVHYLCAGTEGGGDAVGFQEGGWGGLYQLWNESEEHDLNTGGDWNG